MKNMLFEGSDELAENAIKLEVDRVLREIKISELAAQMSEHLVSHRADPVPTQIKSGQAF